MTRTRSFLPLLPALVAATALGACSADVSVSHDLDVAKAKKAITKRLDAEPKGGKVRSLTCPKKVKIVKGGTFTCSYDDEISTGTVTVTMTDTKGTISFKVTDVAALLDMAALKDQIEAFLVKESGGTAVTSVGCPDQKSAEPGKSFVCTFKLEIGQTGEVTVTMKDASGNVGLKITKVDG